MTNKYIVLIFKILNYVCQSLKDQIVNSVIFLRPNYKFTLYKMKIKDDIQTWKDMNLNGDSG